MTPTVLVLAGILVLWMSICVWCGFTRRFRTFAVVLLAGLALNFAWMVLGLGAHLLERHALMAQAAVVLYGLCAMAAGWLAGRLVRHWRATRVEEGNR